MVDVLLAFCLCFDGPAQAMLVCGCSQVVVRVVSSFVDLN